MSDATTAEALAEVIGLAKTDPNHELVVSAKFVLEAYGLGYARGKAEPVRVTAKDIVRDGAGDIARIVEYPAVAERPAGEAR